MTEHIHAHGQDQDPLTSGLLLSTEERYLA